MLLVFFVISIVVVFHIRTPKPSINNHQSSVASSTYETTTEPVKSSKKSFPIIKTDIREHVYFNQLPSKLRLVLLDTWQDAKIIKLILNDHTGKIINEKYMGEQVLRITYKTNVEETPTLNVYVAADTYEVVGYGHTKLNIE
jgi:hypothetical protein